MIIYICSCITIFSVTTIICSFTKKDIITPFSKNKTIKVIYVRGQNTFAHLDILYN